MSANYFVWEHDGALYISEEWMPVKTDEPAFLMPKPSDNYLPGTLLEWQSPEAYCFKSVKAWDGTRWWRYETINEFGDYTELIDFLTERYK